MNNVSFSWSAYRNVEQTAPPAQRANAASRHDALPDWLEGIVRTLSKLPASDVAQVGDLMINGRHGAILAERTPARN